MAKGNPWPPLARAGRIPSPPTAHVCSECGAPNGPTMTRYANCRYGGERQADPDLWTGGPELDELLDVGAEPSP